jgi:aminoglycoside phosphotransferase (APT) family kinase protein
LTRQLRRVTEASDRYGAPSPHDRDWRAVQSQLSVQRLPGGAPTITHGDYRLSDLIVKDGNIAAVLDWEVCAIGDPLADLAWLMDDWRQPDEPDEPDEPAIVMPSPTRVGRFPGRDEMVSAYRDVTGFDVSQLDYYRAFTQWRAASLLQGVLSRRQAGVMGAHAAVEPVELEQSIGALLTSAARRLH